MPAVFRPFRRWFPHVGQGYRGAMGIARRGTPVAPVPRAANLEAFIGMWVAVVDGEVVAAEKTSRELAYRLHQMDHRKRARVVMEYVRPASDAYIIGVG